MLKDKKISKSSKSTKTTTPSEPPKAVSFVGKRPNPITGPEVNIPCQRGKDMKTKGQSCDSKRAFNISKNPGGSHASFQCLKCGFQWEVAMGGNFVA